MNLSDEELSEFDIEMKALSAQERIAWARERFGAGVVLSTSFGLQSSVMLNLVLQVSKEIPIIFVDTGYLFPETYQYAMTLQEKLGFRVKTYSAKMSPAFQEVILGKSWEQGDVEMKRYNFINIYLKCK